MRKDPGKRTYDDGETAYFFSKNKTGDWAQICQDEYPGSSPAVVNSAEEYYKIRFAANWQAVMLARQDYVLQFQNGQLFLS